MEFGRFVYLFANYKNWILHGMALDAAKAAHLQINTIFVPQTKRNYLQIGDSIRFFLNTPPRENSLFINHSVFQHCLERFGDKPKNARVFFTHNNYTQEAQLEKLSHDLSFADKIFTYNATDKKFLESIGIASKKLKVMYGAVDRKLFYPSTKEPPEKFVLIVGDCKKRKRPSLILEVVERNPDIKFLIHGRFWNDFLSKRQTLVNLEYRDFDFSRHPNLIRSASSFLSLSSLEGGPFPTLEALASGTPVVVTDTGWNKEVVPPNGGIVLSSEPSISEITEAIHLSFELKQLSFTVDLLKGKFTWKEMATDYFNITNQ